MNIIIRNFFFANPPEKPVREIVFNDNLFAIFKALITFFDLPDELITIKTSPLDPYLFYLITKNSRVIIVI